MPTRNSQRLAACVAALSRQNYPSGALEIVVVDDRSDVPVDRERLPHGNVELRVLRTDGGDFGAGHARNVGAATAEGEVLVFVDADILGAPDLISAHASWHAAASDVIVVGQLRQVDLANLADDDLADATIDHRLQGMPWHPVAWSARFLERTDQLRHERPDIWAIVVGANVSIRRDRFEEIGGFTTFGRRGIEDTELGYRAYLHGCLFVPEPAAYGWHPATRHLDDEAARTETKRRRAELIEDRVALPPFRGSRRVRQASVPRTHVDVRVEEEPAEAVLACVDGLLDAAGGDVSVALHLPSDYADAALVAEGVAAESRVALGGPVPQGTPVLVTMPALAPVVPGALKELTAPVLAGTVGAVRALRDTGDPVIAVSARALGKVRRIIEDDGAASADDADGLIEELFGCDLQSAELLGFGAAERTIAGMSRGQLSAAARVQLLLEHNDRLRNQLESARATKAKLAGQLAALRSRKIVRFADATGRLVRRERS